MEDDQGRKMVSICDECHTQELSICTPESYNERECNNTKNKELSYSYLPRITEDRLSYEQYASAPCHPIINSWNCKIVFASVFLMECAINYDSGAIPAVLIELMSNFDINDIGQGLLGALPYIGLVIASPLVGHCFQKYSAKRILTTTLTANLMSTILLACSYSVWILFISRLLIGITQSGFTIYAPVWVDEFAPQGKMTLWMGLIQGGAVLGTMLGYLGAGFFRATNRDWRLAIWIQSSVIFMLLLIFIITPAKYIDVSEDDRRRSRQKTNSRIKLQTTRQSLNKRIRSDVKISDNKLMIKYAEDSQFHNVAASNGSSKYPDMKTQSNNHMNPTQENEAIAFSNVCPKGITVKQEENGPDNSNIELERMNMINHLPDVDSVVVPKHHTLGLVPVVGMRERLMRYSIMGLLGEEYASRKLVSFLIASPSTTTLEAMKISAAQDNAHQVKKGRSNSDLQQDINVGETQQFVPTEALHSSTTTPHTTSILASVSPLDICSTEASQLPKNSKISTSHSNSCDQNFDRLSIVFHGMDVTIIHAKHKTMLSVNRLIRNPIYMLVTLCLCVLFFEVTGIQFWSTRFFEETLNVAPSLILVSFSSTAATAPIFGVLLGGILVDRLGGYKTDRGMMKTLLLCSAFGFCVSLFGVVASISSCFWIVLCSIWFILLLGGAILPAATGIIIAVVDSHDRAFASGFSMAQYNIFGYILGTFIPGALMEATGLHNGMRIIFLWSFLGFIGAMIAAFIAWKETTKTKLKSIVSKI